MKKELKFFGVVSIIVGLVLVISFNTSLTGFAIFETVGGSFGDIFGLIFIIAGMFMLEASEFEKIIKSYRRHLEKKWHRPVGYEEAERKYLPKYQPVRMARRMTSEDIVTKEYSREENEAKKMLERNYLPTTYRELTSIAKHVGCFLKEGKRHTIPIYQGKNLEPIPRHREIKREMSRKIMNDLATIR